MTGQDIKNSILQLAIEGKLVEQRKEEGTAEELYKHIQEEKKKLIKEKKIKKIKVLPEITEDDIPFDIPDNWKWVLLGDLCNQITDGTHKTPKYVDAGVPFLSVKNISQGYLDKINTKFITVEEHEELIKRCNPEIGDILFCRIGTLGKALLLRDNFEFSIFVSLGMLKLTNSVIAEYLELMMNSPEFYRQIDKVKVGGSHTNKINLRDVPNFLIPLPPVKEQKRIIDRIEELKPYVEKYDQAHSEVVELNKKFPEDMQKSILQYAVQGKLVEQREEEGTAEELYQQIQEEKKKLIKEKTIKKSKALPEITEDEIPFDIPDSWQWVRLGDVLTKITDGTHNSPANFDKGEYMYVTAKNIKSHGVDLSNISYVNEGVHRKIYDRCNPEYGDILLIKDGATTGVVTVNNIREQFSMLSSVALLKVPIQLSAYYIVYVLRSDLFYQNMRKQMKGTGITRITLKQIGPMIIPIPPLEEQKRIVAKIEELMPLAEQLVD